MRERERERERERDYDDPTNQVLSKETPTCVWEKKIRRKPTVYTQVASPPNN